MNKTKTDIFQELVKERKAQQKTKKFSGTLSDYLELIEENKKITALAHRRLYDTILSQGVTRMSPEDSRCENLFNGDQLRTYDYFQSKFFGMERSLAKIMRYLHSAAMKGEESRQVLLLMGPVGAGKSALVEHIKRSLDGQSYFHLEGDPQRGEPLQLIPRSLRKEWGVVGLLGQIRIRKTAVIPSNWVKLKEIDSVKDLYLVR